MLFCSNLEALLYLAQCVPTYQVQTSNSTNDRSLSGQLKQLILLLFFVFFIFFIFPYFKRFSVLTIHLVYEIRLCFSFHFPSFESFWLNTRIQWDRWCIELGFFFFCFFFWRKVWRVFQCFIINWKAIYWENKKHKWKKKKNVQRSVCDVLHGRWEGIFLFLFIFFLFFPFWSI